MGNSKVTLRELVTAVSEFARDDEEVVATVAHLVNSGRVRLEGGLAGAKVRLDTREPRPRAAAAHA